MLAFEPTQRRWQAVLHVSRPPGPLSENSVVESNKTYEHIKLKRET